MKNAVILVFWVLISLFLNGQVIQWEDVSSNYELLQEAGFARNEFRGNCTFLKIRLWGRD